MRDFVENECGIDIEQIQTLESNSKWMFIQKLKSPENLINEIITLVSQVDQVEVKHN